MACNPFMKATSTLPDDRSMSLTAFPAPFAPYGTVTSITSPARSFFTTWYFSDVTKRISSRRVASRGLTAALIPSWAPAWLIASA